MELILEILWLVFVLYLAYTVGRLTERVKEIEYTLGQLT